VSSEDYSRFQQTVASSFNTRSGWQYSDSTGAEKKALGKTGLVLIKKYHFSGC
jgi:hypothetical protein